MNKKTTLLIVALFLVTCGLLYAAIATTPQKKTEVATSPTPTPLSVNAHTTLSLIEAPASQSSSLYTKTVEVVVSSNKNNVNGVQIELSYDPQALSDVKLSPGPFFAQPNVLLNSIDANNGRISYAVTQQIGTAGIKGKGIAAFMYFNMKPATHPMATAIHFLPKSAVAADGILESVLQKTYDISVAFPLVSPTLTQGAASPQISPTK